jgi:hypothetical protein
MYDGGGGGHAPRVLVVVEAVEVVIHVVVESDLVGRVLYLLIVRRTT